MVVASDVWVGNDALMGSVYVLEENSTVTEFVSTLVPVTNIVVLAAELVPQVRSAAMAVVFSNAPDNPQMSALEAASATKKAEVIVVRVESTVLSVKLATRESANVSKA